MNCIYCRAPTTADEPEEHIVPEGLVGDQLFTESAGTGNSTNAVRLILDDGQVCGSCNHQLSPLDAHLQKQFGFLKAYWNPVGTKKGRPATVDRPGMHATHRSDGPFVVLNDERHPVTTDKGVVVHPTGQHEDAVRMKDFTVDGDVARFTIQQPMRVNKRFMRALHKIGFELLCFRKGAASLLDSSYDPLRAYIRYGQGDRRMVFTTSGEAGLWEQSRFSLQQIPGTEDWIAILHLASIFYLDLSAGNDLYSRVDVAQLRANNMVLWTDAGGGRPLEGEDGPSL